LKYLKIDDQTLSDLSIFETSGKPSIYGLYNKTRTQGGAAKLENLFRHPLADEHSINERAAVFEFFSRREYIFPLDAETVGSLAYYMENNDVRSQLQAGGQSFGQRLKDMVSTDADFVFVRDGVQATLRLFYGMRTFAGALQLDARDTVYEPVLAIMIEALNRPEFELINQLAGPEFDIKINPGLLAELDKQIRFAHRENILRLLDAVYELDVHIAIGQLARTKGFHFAKAINRESAVLHFKKVYHPHVEEAVANDLYLDRGHNILFLTGANMAGKSTLMRSIGVALYVGHMGLPVAAEQFEFAVRDGIYTSINLADNLSQGASHYYAEVLRVKEVAKELSGQSQLFVIFDELFRGTNVKDAYDATIALTSAFAAHRGSQFIISTHIMEAGEVLQQKTLPISYQFLPTELRNNTPFYNRVLREGITADRQGMIIIQNEGILDMLDEGIRKMGESTCHS
jgi:DNA mismatch repair ATPase MutS